MNPVFVLDDDESYRELLMLTLEDHCGVSDVQGFSGGRELLRQLGAPGPETPALVLLDLHMPDMAGLELLREIRRVRPSVPVAFLSGGAGDEEREDGLAAGAFAFLRKPVAYPDLIALLQDLVRSLPHPA